MSITGLSPDEERPIDPLVQGFRTHIKALKSEETKEATVRQNYIDPFWRALGWDVGDTRQLGPAEAEVIIEKSIETAESAGLRNRRPDYLFRLKGFPRFVAITAAFGCEAVEGGALAQGLAAGSSETNGAREKDAFSVVALVLGTVIR